VDGREHVLRADDVILTMRAPEGYSVEREGAHAVALDLAIDEELREEGRAREIVHAVQAARKAAGLEVEDRIELALDGDEALTRAAQAHRDYVAGETLAVELAVGDNAPIAASDGAYSEKVQIEALALTIGLRRAPPG
jgi:isoleucyl-tRNA synthetase